MIVLLIITIIDVVKSLFQERHREREPPPTSFVIYIQRCPHCKVNCIPELKQHNQTNASLKFTDLNIYNKMINPLQYFSEIFTAQAIPRRYVIALCYILHID